MLKFFRNISNFLLGRNYLQIPNIDQEELDTLLLEAAMDHRGDAIDSNWQTRNITWLLENGANIETVDDQNNTPLLLAARSLNGRNIRILIENGANREHRNANRLLYTDLYRTSLQELSVIIGDLGLGFNPENNHQDERHTDPESEVEIDLLNSEEENNEIEEIPLATAVPLAFSQLDQRLSNIQL
jgi:ankyrin repeat protein